MKPNKTPTIPPIKDNSADSHKNWKTISLLFAPIVILIPISLVLSDTETSIIFIIPIPPTINDMDAIDVKNS